MNGFGIRATTLLASLANYGVMLEVGEYQRNTLVKNFGDTAFALSPDSVGLAAYDPADNPFGYFVILRIE